MFYNKKIMVFNNIFCILTIAFLLIFILDIMSCKVAAPIFIGSLGLQQFLSAYNCYKKNEEGLIIFNVVLGILCICIVMCGTCIFHF